MKCGYFKTDFFILYTNHLPQPPTKYIGFYGFCQENYFLWRHTFATILLYTPNMKKYNPEIYIDLAYASGQLVALLEQRNILQVKINEKEAEVEKMKKEKEENE